MMRGKEKMMTPKEPGDLDTPRNWSSGSNS